MKIDLGDLTLSIDIEVPGLHRRQVAIRMGVPRNSSEEFREAMRRWRSDPTSRMFRGGYSLAPTRIRRKVGPFVDLKADQEVDLTLVWTDEMGNPTTEPADAQSTWTVDDTSVIALTQGETGVVASATGQLGTANVHVEVTRPDHEPVTGDLQIVVVAGDAERVEIQAGEPREVTPDDGPTEPVQPFSPEA